MLTYVKSRHYIQAGLYMCVVSLGVGVAACNCIVWRVGRRGARDRGRAVHALRPRK